MALVTINGELYHYGVPGMRWGRRKARGHAGPGRYITSKRQLAGDKRDLNTINKGGHLSVGLTKKRQAQFDKRDKEVIEKRIVKNEAKRTENKPVRYSNRQIKRDMDNTFNNTYKELHEKYKKTTPATAADRAYAQAKKINTKHLIDTYGKERMNQYYAAERKKLIAAGTVLVGGMASMSVAALTLEYMTKKK